jgi:predicted nucleic acid-binding Zn finger protein
MEDSRLLRKAEMAIKSNRVIKLEANDSFFYTFIFLGNGKTGKDHILNEKSCDCKSFLFNRIYRNTNICYHLIALNKAIETERYTTIKLKSREILEIITDIYANGKSLKLRKVYPSK